jgi:prepilin-type N-terminal cleavage/methylation domain-containing protein/prepilin-type processing-associated H-X9-DG protein
MSFNFSKISRRAFTLIELLTVIAIISLLVGLLTPALSKARQVSKKTVCQANLHSIGQGFRMYLDNHKDVMPYAAYLPSAHLNDYPRIVDVLGEYLQNPEVFRCSADTKKNYYLSEGSSYAYMQELAGQHVDRTSLAQQYQLQLTELPVMHDYETFHNARGNPGAMNYLFGDGHVGSKIE